MDKYYNPVKVIKTENWFGELNNHIDKLNISYPIILTSKGNRERLGMDKIFNPKSIYSDVKENPSFQDCEDIMGFCEGNVFDGVLAIGGGSVMDLAKVVIAHLCLEKSNIFDLINYNEKFPQKLPSIFVPTTHGTGSEVTMWGTLWHMEEGKKYSISHKQLYPDVAILDGNLTKTLPLNISITTVLDALSHSFESIWNKNSNNRSTKYAISAISKILQNVENLKLDPKDVKIRSNLLEASTISGLAFSNTKTAAAHSMSYPLTINYGIPHGIASSICLVPLLEYNKNSIISQLDNIMYNNSITYTQLVQKIKSVSKGVLPSKLRDLGVKESEIDELANQAFLSERMQNNVKNLNKEDVKLIYSSVY